jgi:hypothetical protein
LIVQLGVMTMFSLLLAASLQAATPQLNPQLGPLGFLAGSCWRATMPGGSQVDLHCFTAMLGGRFVRDRHVVSPSSYSGETLYRWDPAARIIRFDYYASDGSHMAGTALAAPDGLNFPEADHVDPAGTPMTLRSAWTREGEDAYVAVTEYRQGDSWRILARARFERAGPAPAD